MSKIFVGTPSQIQNAICLLCKANTTCEHCILGYSNPNQDELIDNPTSLCTVISEFGNFDKNVKEVLAICEWLYTDNDFRDNEEFFVRDEDYYLRLNNPP